MIALTLQWIFWLCIGAIAYNYVGYPIALFLLVALADLKHSLMSKQKNGSSLGPNRDELSAHYCCSRFCIQ